MGLENPLHLALLLLVLLLVFGAKRLPEMGRGLGSGMRGFKEALSHGESTPTLVHAETTTERPAATDSARPEAARPAA